MESINKAKMADFLMVPDILRFTTPKEIPLSFTYGDKVVKGIPAEFSPKVTYRPVSANIAQYIIEGTDKNGLNIRAEYVEYLDFPVTEWLFYFSNTSKEDTPVLKNIRIEGKLVCPDATLEYGNGDTKKVDGYHFFKKKLDEKFTLTPTTGTACQGAFPYMTLHGSDREIRAAIGWPTKWVAELTPCDGGVIYSCGQDRCATLLHSGETYRTPRLNLMVYTNENAPHRGINLWRRWYMKHIIPRQNGEPISPKLCLIHFNEGGKPEFEGATEKMQTFAMREFVRRGMKPDVWWVDAGWYKCKDWHDTGVFSPDIDRFPDGFATLGSACEENGVELLLWFEPERVRRGIKHDIEKNDWILSANDAEGVPLKNQLLDFSKHEVVEWVISRVDAIIKKGKVKVYRQDFNMDPLPIWEQNEAPDRIGMTENLHAQGYLHYWDELLHRNPEIWIDSCASGGRRNDLETMRRAVPLHYTDVGYGNHPVKQKQYREMFEWVPYFRAHACSWDDPETGSYEAKKGREKTAFDFYTALTPALSSNINYDDTEENFAFGQKMHAIWRRAAEIELSGDYYPITECRCSASDWYAAQFDDEVHGKGFIHAIRNIHAEEESLLIVPPCVHAGRIYSLENAESGERFELTAEEFAKGIEVSVPKRSGAVYFYTFI